MLEVHYTNFEGKKVRQAKPTTKGGSLLEYPHFQSSASSFCLLPRVETLLSFRRISRAIPGALTDLDLSPSPDEIPIWDSEYYRLPVAISVGGAFQPSITFPFAQRATSH
jgi:hypothetical protein